MITMRMIFQLTLISLILSSCYSYKIFPKEYRHFTYTGEKKEVFVLNPEMSKEYEILKKAGVFKIMTDSSNRPVTRIRLYPLERAFVCGQPITASLLFLGQLPVLLPDRYQFRFDELRATDTVQRNYELQVATHYWFWDMFVVKKNFNQKAGQTLLAQYYNE